MNTTEKKLLEIISKITTDEKFQTKVLALYEDYQTENLRKYAWFKQSEQKENDISSRYNIDR
jgi:hypothetical protein